MCDRGSLNDLDIIEYDNSTSNVGIHKFPQVYGDCL